MGNKRLPMGGGAAFGSFCRCVYAASFLPQATHQADWPAPASLAETQTRAAFIGTCTRIHISTYIQGVRRPGARGVPSSGGPGAYPYISVTEHFHRVR